MDLLAFKLTATQAQYIATFALVLAGVLLFLLAWRRRELRRTEALEVLEKIAPWGIEPINKLLRAYAIGNYIGQDSIGRVFREIISDLKGGGLTSMLRRLGWKIVKGAFLSNAEDRAELRKLLDNSEALAETEIETPPEV